MTGRFAGREFRPTKTYLQGMLRREQHELLDVRRRLASAESERDALRDQIEHEGCATSHLGERTYSCRAESLCGLCRLRQERDAASALADRLAKAARMAQEPLNLSLGHVGCGVESGGVCDCGAVAWNAAADAAFADIEAALLAYDEARASKGSR